MDQNFPLIACGHTVDPQTWQFMEILKSITEKPLN